MDLIANCLRLTESVEQFMCIRNIDGSIPCYQLVAAIKRAAVAANPLQLQAVSQSYRRDPYC